MGVSVVRTALRSSYPGVIQDRKGREACPSAMRRSVSGSPGEDRGHETSGVKVRRTHRTVLSEKRFFPDERRSGRNVHIRTVTRWRKMKRALALLLACGLLLGVAATSGFAADKVVIKMAGMKPDGEPETLGMRKFGEILKELSGGKYEVQVFPNSQLGKEDAYIARASSRCAPPAPRRPPSSLRWPCSKRPCCSTTTRTPVAP